MPGPVVALALSPDYPTDRLVYVGWEAKGKLEFQAAVARFRENNVEVSVGDAALCEMRGVKELIRFRDPVGYQHELFYAQKWTPRSFVPGRPHGGFVAGNRGFGHMVEATLFWHPWYRFSGAIKVCTAVVSWATVLALLPVLPRALALPGLATVTPPR